ncbi:hypothetical protein Tco_0975803 [Tanacetum coccineum]|uniref:Uncharacterized protein n=1 Tax=Tanacetum coccineum TaxID=301880 RepID=A0ABQ5EFM2_9ASTR
MLKPGDKVFNRKPVSQFNPNVASNLNLLVDLAKSNPSSDVAKSSDVVKAKVSAGVVKPKPNADVVQPKASTDVLKVNPNIDVVQPKASIDVVKVSTDVVRPKPKADLPKDKMEADLLKDKPKADVPKRKTNVAKPKSGPEDYQLSKRKRHLSKEDEIDEHKKKSNVKMLKRKITIKNSEYHLNNDEVEFDSSSDEGSDRKARKVRRKDVLKRNKRRSDFDFSSDEDEDTYKRIRVGGTSLFDLELKPLNHELLKLWVDQFYPKSVKDIRVGNRLRRRRKIPEAVASPNLLRVSLRRLRSDAVTQVLTPSLVSSDGVARNCDAVSRYCTHILETTSCKVVMFSRFFSN